MHDLILREDTGSVARLQFNRPDSFNALSLEMIDALQQALIDIQRSNNIRVVIIAAKGKAFCAGHDLRQMQAERLKSDAGQAAFDALFARCSDLMQLIPALPQPVIAEVQGIATAAGCQLVASCDLALAAEGVRFGVNGINVGLFCSTPMVPLSRAIPAKAAFELLMTGEFMDAERARELGLINHVVPASQLPAKTMELANRIAEKLPAAIQMGKRAFYDQRGLDVAEAYKAAGSVMVENMLLPETDEGITAFLERRKPNKV